VSWNHCIRAAIGRRATSFTGRVVTVISHRSEPWRRMAAELAFIVSASLVTPPTFVTVNSSIQTRGERRALRFNY
jgi:hypothetical protein